ncbi:multidrug ABC transporter permease [Salipaludibacillus neizhouensis]|uniref:Multidrug ABC transporter permease n=1 Tax=Salipaludibacillus neizhouensis TaxID=885475 RepID=A0A3A9K7F7_9BACI|nr:ABC transporter permease [Salipaludibacillus neizhouensis]RKL68159.1 multidrug ABC transporter permease [Salipaludibacillus neizhouensis]
MKSIYLLQWQRFRREPVLVVSFFVLTILFISVLAGFGTDNKMTVYTFSDASLSDSDRDYWLEKLNESNEFEFQTTEESQARQAVAEGEVSLALKLMKEDYLIFVAADEPGRYLVEGYIHQIYSEQLRLNEVENQLVGGEFHGEVERLLAEPSLTVVTSSLEGEHGSYESDGQLQVLFGMTLFFSIYTIMYSLGKIVEEKQWGTWNRLILSPLSKTQIYIGHLMYSFTIGFIQILLIFLFFQYVFHFDIGDRFGTILVIIGFYTFAIVALSMLLMGAVKTSQQFQTVVPLVATSIAMLGGAFWPIEVVSNPFMIALSKGMPIAYGLDALKGAAIYDRGVFDLVEPLSLMLLFGVICMGVGINLMERHKA